MSKQNELVQFSRGASGGGSKNLIINGGMTVAQRGTSAVTATANFPVDRFRVEHSTDGAFTAQQSTDVPSGEGFVNSIKYQTTTADLSLAASQYFYTRQIIEGFNSAHLMFGSSSAKTLTLSFWVKSSLTGTFGGSVWNNAFNRSYPYSYTIDAANTWEKKTITFTGDTTGTWLTTNGRGINVGWGLGLGSDYSGTAGAWSASGLLSVTGATSLISTLNATWYLTGVQLEVNDNATDFEHKTFSQELQACQRYFCRTYQYGTGTGTATSNACVSTSLSVAQAYASAGNWDLPVTMRTAPTVTVYSTVSGTSGKLAADGTDGNGNATFISEDRCFFYRANDSTGTATNVFLRAQATASAEL